MIQEIILVALTNELFTLRMAVLLLSRLNNGLTHGDLMAAVHHADHQTPAARLLLSTGNVPDHDRFDYTWPWTADIESKEMK